MQQDMRDRAFVVFACLWAIANLFHQAAWPARHVGLGMYALTLTAIFLLLRPRSVRLFLVLLVLQVGMVIHQLPHQASNHWLFTGFVAAAILLSWAGVAVRRRSLRVTGGELFAAFAPVARVQLLILYFFAVLHKLNHDFLTPGVSCATDLMARIAHTLPGLPMGTWSDYLAIYGTLAVEAAIPILLVIRRTRLYGVALGCAFHLSLVFDLNWVFYDFSSLVYALYFLFIPETVLRTMERVEQQGGWVARSWQWLRSPAAVATLRTGLVLLAAVLLLGAAYELVTGLGPSGRVVRHVRNLPRLPFLLYAIVALTVLALAWMHSRQRPLQETLVTLTPRTLGALMIPIVFLNGLTPYFGLKTENAFSMFSNLSTEGGRTNHLFMPVRYRLADYQEDLVQVLESSHPTLQRVADRDELLTYFEFRYLAGRSPGHSVTYRRNGDLHAVHDVADSPELTAAYPAFQRKALQFRRIAGNGGPTPCTH